jgi:hypothetical protein
VKPQPVAARIPAGKLLNIDRQSPPWPQADVLFTDDQWQQTTVLAWCRYRRGWAALMRWAGGTEDWRVHDPDCIRPSVAHLGGFADA